MSSSNPSGSNTPDPQETSYVEMSRPAKNDPFLVGSHCQMDYCNQLDFLPFKCQSCLKIFCLDHRTEDSHKCASPGAWAERKRLAAASKSSIGDGRQVRDRVHIPKGTCASTACTTEIGTTLAPGVHCDQCRQNYCLKHRLREEHDCAAVIEARRRARPGGQALHGVESALDTFRARWKAFAEEAKAKAEKSKGSSFFHRRPNPAVERMKRMNELKSKAKGDAKLPADKRVYLTVAATETNAKGQVPKEMFFYSKDWVVGRMLDAAAKAFQIENLNNRTSDGDNKLHVFYVEGERFLGVSEKIGEALQSGQRVVLTRGGSPPDSVIAMLLSV